MNRVITQTEPTYAMLEKSLYALKGRYPFMELKSIGQSVLHRELYAVKIGSGRENVLFAGGFHAQEWLTSLLLLTFIEDVLSEYEKNGELRGMNARELFRNRSLTVVPIVNPDGVEIVLSGIQSAGHLAGSVKKISGGNLSNWNSNANGVDLNHNYDAGFAELQEMERKAGITEPSPRRYSGSYPHSEPETQAIVNLCKKENFTHALAFHSQGEEIYWHYGGRTPERSRLMGQVLSAVSGYSLAEPSGMASHGGFKDWFIEYFSRPGFTIEIGRGKNPLPISQLPSIYGQLLEMLLVAVVL